MIPTAVLTGPVSSLAEQTCWLDATDQAALVASGDVQPGGLVETAIERIEQLDPALGTVTLRYFDQARAAASALPKSSSLS